MKNKEIAQKLNKIARHLEMDDVDFKPFAYRRASSSILNLEEDIEKIYEEKGRKGIEEISGVGKNIADKIEEFLLTGEMEHLKTLEEKHPVELDELLKVEGLGPKSIKKLYEKLKIKSLEDLEEKAKKGEIASLDGFGEKTEKNILEAIEFLKRDEGKWSLGEVMEVANRIFEKLKSLEEVKRINFAGSLRRSKELVGDVDILISAGKTERVMETFTSFENVFKVLSKGDTRSSVKVDAGFGIDLRVVKKKSFGSALQYFTGSKEHNIKLRKLAIGKGMKLNEYGLFKNGKKIAGKEEEEIYSHLGLSFIPPELREDRGEIEKAIKGEDFSDLCRPEDLKGDLHVHTDWTGGANTLEEMIAEAEKKGYDYLGIADHTEFLRIENGLSKEELRKQRKEIEKMNSKLRKKGSKMRVLQGCEANILKDGSLDMDDETLEKLDYVIAGIHSSFKMNEKDMTDRLIKAIENPVVDIISHPTGRLIKKRESLDLNMGRVFRAAGDRGIAMEINSSPARLDLSDKHIKACVEKGIKMVINSDSHHKSQMDNLSFGVGQARRGWARRSDIINTNNLEDLLSFFKEE